jgi:hypothetical protein
MNMDPIVAKLVGQAVVQHLNGDKDMFGRWVQIAMDEYQRLKEKEHLYATIAEILEAKGVKLLF